MKHIYVGHNVGSMEVFRSGTVPTFATHGDTYAACIGPFRTMRGARFMVKYGNNNPHCRTVYEAEKLARLDAKGLLRSQ